METQFPWQPRCWNPQNIPTVLRDQRPSPSPFIEAQTGSVWTRDHAVAPSARTHVRTPSRCGSWPPAPSTGLDSPGDRTNQSHFLFAGDSMATPTLRSSLNSPAIDTNSPPSKRITCNRTRARSARVKGHSRLVRVKGHSRLQTASWRTGCSRRPPCWPARPRCPGVPWECVRWRALQRLRWGPGG